MKKMCFHSGIQKKYLKSTLILLLLALLFSMIGVWGYMHHTLKNNIIEKYIFADEKMGITLDNLYNNSKEVTAEAILNENIQKSLMTSELTDDEKNAISKYFAYLDLDNIQDYCYMDNKGNVYTRSYGFVNASDIKNEHFEEKLGSNYAKTTWFIAKDTLFNENEDSLFITRYVHSMDYSSEPGVIILKMNPSFLKNVIAMETERSDYDVITGIIDQNKKIYALNTEDSELPVTVTKTLAAACEKASDTGIILSGNSVKGGHLSAYYQKDCGFSIFTYIPDETVTRQTTQILIVLLFIYLVIVVLAILLSILFSNRFTKPIQMITTYMTGFDGEDYTHMPELHTNTELDQIGHSYNEMLGNIEQLVAEIKVQEKELRNSELNMLISQINPHFLYNTLDTIYMLARISKEETTMRMIQALSKYLRLCLSKGSDIVSVEDELENVKSYMEIQQIRNTDLFEYEIDCQVDAKNTKILKLILQPIVENAVKYGFSEIYEGGYIRICIQKENSEIILSVFNSGLPMNETMIRKINGLTHLPISKIKEAFPDKKHGYGVYNILTRLRLKYGENISFSYKADATGTTCTIKIPERGDYDV